MDADIPVDAEIADATEGQGFVGKLKALGTLKKLVGALSPGNQEGAVPVLEDDSSSVLDDEGIGMVSGCILILYLFTCLQRYFHHSPHKRPTI